MKKDVSLLLVEDSQEDATWIQLALRKAQNITVNVDHVEWLSTALTAVGAKIYDIVLLDLTLPDSHGIDTLVSFLGTAPHLPVIVLTGYDDMETAMRCMKFGAQDYQLKGEVNTGPLERSIVYAIERRRRDLVGRRLIRASLSHFTVADEDQPVSLAMLKEHVRKLPKAIEAILAYISKNAPQCNDDLQVLIDAHNVPTMLREMREILHGSEPPPSLAPKATGESEGTRALASRTLRDIKATSPGEEPVDIPTAQEALADVIEDLGRPLEKYDA